MTESEIRESLRRYKFYHCIRLTDAISTEGNPAYVPFQQLCMKRLNSLDLKGKRVLDIGCRDGLFSFAAESAGAAEVIGIDNDVSRAATEFLIPFFKSKVRMHQMNLYDLDLEAFGSFDVVVFPGVLYHLRYPFWGLRRIRDVLNEGGHLIVETAVWRGCPEQAMLYCPIGDESPYEASSCTFFNEKGLADSLASLGFRTIDSEFLGGPTERKNLLTRIRRKLNRAKKRLRGERESIHSAIDRYVSLNVFEGFKSDSVLARYWESTHELHSEYGGGQDMRIPREVLKM